MISKPFDVDEFSKASFSLLTSSAEGLPGVLIESMGRGCIPISYDLPYGPSDIITHGVDEAVTLADRIAAGVTGYTTGMIMIWWMNAVDYPIAIGGKPSAGCVERWRSRGPTITKPICSMRCF